MDCVGYRFVGETNDLEHTLETNHELNSSIIMSATLSGVMNEVSIIRLKLDKSEQFAP